MKIISKSYLLLFLLRYEVDYIREQDHFIAMLKAEERHIVPKMTLQELQLHQQHVDRVVIPDELYFTLAKVRRKLHDEGIRPSDRRFKQSLSILKARAYLNHRHIVERQDLDILGNVLWETIDQRPSTIEILNETVFDSVETFLNRVRPEFESILMNAQHAMISKAPHNRAKLSELLMQGKSLFLEVQAMNRQTPNRPELLALKNDMHKRLLQMTSDVIGF